MAEATELVSKDDLACKSHDLTAAELTVEGGDVVAVVASDTPDVEREVVIPKNIDLTRFNKVKQIYFDHDLEKHPIGAAKWIKATGDGKMISKHFFSKTNELAVAVGDLVKEGIYKSYSIGCLKSTRKLGPPTDAELKAKPNWEGNKIWRGTPLLVEYSVVGQAANPDCVALAVSKSWSKAVKDTLLGVNGNTIRTAATITKSLMDAGMDDACAADMAECAENCYQAVILCQSFVGQNYGNIQLAAAISAVSDFCGLAYTCADLMSKGSDAAIDQCELVMAAGQRAIPLINISGDDISRRCSQAIAAAIECCDECLPDEEPVKKLSEADIFSRIARGIEQATKSIDPDKVVATVLKNVRR